MNRRKFINFLGSAIIGTAIALNLPETIAPVKEAITWSKNNFSYWDNAINPNACAGPITFSMMEKAYKKAIEGNAEPQYIYLPQKAADFIDWKYNKNLNAGIRIFKRRLLSLFNV